MVAKSQVRSLTTRTIGSKHHDFSSLPFLHVISHDLLSSPVESTKNINIYIYIFYTLRTYPVWCLHPRPGRSGDAWRLGSFGTGDVQGHRESGGEVLRRPTLRRVPALEACHGGPEGKCGGCSGHDPGGSSFYRLAGVNLLYWRTRWLDTTNDRCILSLTFFVEFFHNHKP